VAARTGNHENRRFELPELACGRLALPIQDYLEQLHARCLELRAGEVATYIPELAKADPDWFGISLATSDGRVYEVGDTRRPFTIQSISKPFVYGLALEDRGRDAVLKRIGVEPTGDAFNSISLEQGTGRPLNPMINAGAIAAASLVAGHSDQDRIYRILGTFSLYAGRQLSIDQGVYRSESDTGHRNRAIAHMLRNFDILTDAPEGPLDVYFQQCSISVDCRDLSLMGATLANGGVNPLTGERAIRNECVESILSVMATCGMYDYAGAWMYWVGLPAKSGVSGGVLAVLPGQLAIAVFSPRLDARGNSVRGVEVCKQLSSDLGLHSLRVPRSSRSAIRARYDLSAVRSKRIRTADQRELLAELGQRTRIYELHGDLAFSGVEATAWHISGDGADLDCAILDLERVTAIDDAAARIVLALLVGMAERDQRLVLVAGETHSRLLRFLSEHLTGERQHWLLTFKDVDHALEWCEERLLRKHSGWSAPASISLAEHQLCRGLDPAAVECLEAFLERETFAPGELIVRKGVAADRFYLLTRGEVSVTVDVPSGVQRRISTLSAGMTFGELAVVSDAPRSADVRADRPVETYAITTEAFRRLGESRPDIKLVLLENLLRGASHTATRLTEEVTALSR
jgi:glutaminase